MKRFKVDSLLWNYRNPDYPDAVSIGSVEMRVTRRHSVRVSWRQNGLVCGNRLDGSFYGVRSWRNFTVGEFLTFTHFACATHLSVGRLTVSVLRGGMK